MLCVGSRLPQSSFTPELDLDHILLHMLQGAFHSLFLPMLFLTLFDLNIPERTGGMEGEDLRWRELSQLGLKAGCTPRGDPSAPVGKGHKQIMLQSLSSFLLK